MKGILIWGAGGHGRVVLDVVRAAEPHARVAFFDDRPKWDRVGGVPVYSEREVWDDLSAHGFSHFVVAIGDNRVRERCFAFALRKCEAAALIHPSAVVSSSARIGCGTVVLPRAVINAGAVIGLDSIVNTGVIVEHDCQIGAHVHLAPGSVLGGQVIVGDLGQVGIGATVLPGIRLGRGAILGAGGVAVHDVHPETVVAGVPARILERAS